MANCLTLCLLLVNAIVISGAPIVKDNSMEGMNVEEAVNHIKDAIAKYETNVADAKRSIKTGYADYESEIDMLFESGKEDATQDFNVEEKMKSLRDATAKYEKNAEENIATLKAAALICRDLCVRYTAWIVGFINNASANYVAKVDKIFDAGKEGTQEADIKEEVKSLRDATAKYELDVEKAIKVLKSDAEGSIGIQSHLRPVKESTPQGADILGKGIKVLKAAAAKYGLDIEEELKALKVDAAKYKKYVEEEIEKIESSTVRCKDRCVQYYTAAMRFIKGAAAKYESKLENFLKSGKEDTAQGSKIENLIGSVQEDTMEEMDMEDEIKSFKATAAKYLNNAADMINSVRGAALICKNKCVSFTSGVMNRMNDKATKYVSKIENLLKYRKDDTPQGLDLKEAIKALKAAAAKYDVDLEEGVKSLKAIVAKHESEIEKILESGKNYSPQDVDIQKAIKALKAAAAKYGVDIEKGVKSLKAAAAKHESEIEKLLQSAKGDQSQDVDIQKGIKALKDVAAKHEVDIGEGFKSLKAVAAKYDSEMENILVSLKEDQPEELESAKKNKALRDSIADHESEIGRLLKSVKADPLPAPIPYYQP